MSFLTSYSAATDTLGTDGPFTIQIVYLFIAAFLGFAFSILTMVITHIMNNRGHLTIYGKIVHCKFNRKETWGVQKNKEGEIVFHVPLWLEILNTSNTTRVIRDLNLGLFNNGEQIGLMTQVNKTDQESYGCEGAYSFVISPRSLLKVDCHFKKEKNDLSQGSIFNEIKVVYYNEKNKKRSLLLKKIDDCWCVDPRQKDVSYKKLM